MTFNVTANLRVSPYEKLRIESLEWYRDPELQWLVNGTREPLGRKGVEEMYDWQKENGELYYVEYFRDNVWQTVGDVWLSVADFALVIAPTFQQNQIGSALVNFFLTRCRDTGVKEMNVAKVYDWNLGSKALFTKLGFKEVDAGDYYVSYRYTF